MAPDHHEEEGLLGWLDSPRLVLGAAGLFVLGMCFLAVLLWVDRGNQIERIDAIVQQRLLEEEAAKREQVATCFARAAQGPALRSAVIAIERSIMDPNDRAALRNFRELSLLNTPTIRECRQLAKRLNVSVPEGVR